MLPSKFSFAANAGFLRFTENGNDKLIGGDGLINIMVGCDGQRPVVRQRPGPQS